MARPSMVVRTVRVPEQLWYDAHEISDLRGEVLSEIIRAALVAYVRKGVK